MSGRGSSLRSEQLSSLGRLKVVTRFLRYGQSLAPEVLKVLLFILDRTVGWNKAMVAISRRDFMNGTRSRRRNELSCLPIGLSMDVVNEAIALLVEVGAIRANTIRASTYYSLNYDWEVPGLMPMWEVDEDDYCYPEGDL